nr:TonB-dependent receptor [Saliniradius amylolyticus]
MAFSGQALAQQAQQETQTAEESVEKIQVTGSHIKGVDLEGSQPLTVLDADDIARSGANTISELMNTISQTRGGQGSFTTAQSGATSNSTPPGQAAASLRGMGPASTLTLINGRRVAASSFASGTENFVDINSIPLAAIDRVEVLATGASATYGADAVAGVINYILKDDYIGAEFNASYENSTASSDEGKTNINLVWGGEVAGGNLTVFADLYDRNAFHAKDRAFTRDPVLESNYSYLPKEVPNIYYESARDFYEIPAPECKRDYIQTEYGETICPYYSNEDDWLESPLESQSAGFIYNTMVGDLEWNTDFFYSRTKSTSISTPAAPLQTLNYTWEAVFSSPNQIYDGDGPYVPESALDIYSDEVRNGLLDNMWIDQFLTPAGQELWGFRFDSRFPTPRTVEVETDAFRLVSELSGFIGNWEWDSAVTISRSESEQVASEGIYNRLKYHSALAGELCSDGTIAAYDDSTDTLSCGAGSLAGMYNPFLVGDSANDAILALAQERPTRDGESTVYGWDFKIAGDLMEFNNDYIRSAFGLEYRQEEISDVPSENARAQFENDYRVGVFGFGSSLSEADRKQWGAFAELYVPLAENLEAQLAGRFDDYDDFGSTFNPKVALSYRPIDDLIMRASWATSFRAPSLTQAGVKLRTTTSTFDCGANQDVADLYCEGDGTEVSVNTLELGNPNLEAEESDSVSLGFGYSPTDNTTITVDYWAFEHEKLVDTNMTGVLARAIDDASLRHCGLVPNGQIGIAYNPAYCNDPALTDAQGRTIEEEGANLYEILEASNAAGLARGDYLDFNRDHILLLENTGTQEVSGIDYRFDHRFELQGGDLSLSLEGTHYLEFDRNKPGSDEIEELAGTWTYPEDIASASVFWDAEDWFAGLTAYYTGSYEDDIDGLRGRNLDELEELGALDANGEREVSSWTTVQLSTGYKFEKANLNLTINNLFDREPPLAYGSSRGFDSYNANAYGTTYRVSFTYFFE